MTYSGIQSCKVTASTLKKCSLLKNFAQKVIEIRNCKFSNN